MEELYSNSKIKELEEQIVQNNKIIDVITEHMHKIVWCVAGIIFLLFMFTYDSEYGNGSMIFVIEIFWIVLSYGIQFFIMILCSRSNKNKLAEIDKIRKEEELVRLAEAKAEREKLEREEEKIKKESQQVADTSPLYKSLIALNTSYGFEKIDSAHNYSVELTSKQQLEKLDIWESFKYTIENDELYYTTLLEKLNRNTDLWNEYNTRYSENWVYTEPSQIDGMSLEKYQEYEMQLYDSNKITQPTIDVTIDVEASYTSPSGRNTYAKNATFSKSQIYRLLEEVKANREDRKKRAEQVELEHAAQQEEKRIIAEKKRLKEQKLRELDKRERELLKKESEIKNKERDFLAATKGHIYSASDSPLKVADKIVISESDTPLEKMKKLKKLFDNGEISYEEYSEKRKELL